MDTAPSFGSECELGSSDPRENPMSGDWLFQLGSQCKCYKESKRRFCSSTEGASWLPVSCPCLSPFHRVNCGAGSRR